MAELSIKSVASEFQEDIHYQAGTLTRLSQDLPRMHRSIHQSQSPSSYYGKHESPDEFSYQVSFSIVLAMLSDIVSSIVEAEEALESLMDDEADQGELAHAQGELYAYKKAYIDLLPVIAQVETVRLQASVSSVSAKEYMQMIGTGGKLPKFDQYYTRGLPQIMLSVNHPPQGTLYWMKAQP